MNERKLASIQRVEKLEKIEGADFIQKCKLYNLEWQFVVRRGEFEIDNLCVYFEIDSILPEREEFEFMRDRKFRVKTIKLKGVISQGLCMPVSLFKELNHIKIDSPFVKTYLGMDVTKILGVEKYLSPSERSEFKGNKISKFPEFIVKTDEERIQTMDYRCIYEQFHDKYLNVTEKIDYQSATFFSKKNKRTFFNFIFRNKKFGVCSRNVQIKENDHSLYWKMFRKYNIEKILKKQKNEFIIQGEQGGPGIQDNKYGLKTYELWIFNVIENRNGILYHYDYNEMKNFCIEHNLRPVPLLCEYYQLPENVNELIGYSKGKSVLNNKIHREGIVVRLVERGIKKLSFKVVNPDFLLKYE